MQRRQYRRGDGHGQDRDRITAQRRAPRERGVVEWWVLQPAHTLIMHDWASKHRHAAHAANIDQPEAFNAAVLTFLDEVI